MAQPSAPSAEPAPAPKKSFLRKPLGCLLAVLVGGLLFSALLLVLGLWFAGSNHALNLASKIVGDKSGGALRFADNDTNLFAGRVHLKGIELTNPSRFTDKRFVTINELKADVDLPSALAVGMGSGDTIRLPEVTFDLGSVSIVGAAEWIKDNNALDFKNAFAPARTEQPAEQPAPEEPKPEPAPTEQAPKKHFRIGKLVLRIDRLRALSHATTPGEQPKVLLDDSVGLNWEFTDVSDENIKEKVYDVVRRDIAKLGGKFAKFAAALAIAEIGKYTEQAAKLAEEKAAEITNKAAGAVDQGLQSVSSGLGGLLGGKKKEETK